MNDTPETTDAATAVETAPKAKPKAKKPAPKKAPAKKAKAGAKVDRSTADAPAKERRTAFLKLLRKLGARSAMDARPISELASKLGYTNYDVYCLAYHKFPLAAGGYVKTAKLEDQRELSVYLTAKGAKGGPDDE